MAQAKSGDTVRVHYTGTFDDGTVFDTSMEREPLQFTVGAGMVIAGFDNAVTGMEPGQKKTVNIPAEQAYGPRSEELVAEIGRDRLPADLEIEIGQQLQVGLADGDQAVVMIVDVSETTVTLDANHPMAGMDLNFELELIEIV
ncbi:MAG: peptidylprolyl isomerase [Chlorobiaceae bacterium]|nr:peptidylprolyl isomerase [Chlorobiales bacterium]MCE1273532.1 peptidylprolyl isomerase [Chlorobiales bacterium]NTU91822.1 peptidylprolyl isomerase [Chlorobiaceae bacterium]NTV26698.1 peptidylprolyl isomerase [Chlorobiaceae bacterium]